MKSRWETLGGALLVTIFTAGCASTKLCQTIPAQVDLALAKRDQAQAAYKAKAETLERTENNSKVSVTRLENLEKEREEIRRLLIENGITLAPEPEEKP